MTADKDLQGLATRFPLFTFRVDNHKDTIRAELGDPGHATSFPREKLSRETDQYLVAQHRAIKIKRDLEEHYPDLHVLISEDQHGARVSVWVKRDGRDAEAITDLLYLHDLHLHPALRARQVEASLAKQPGCFFCSGHDLAEPVENYGYSHFAGKYCKTWAAEHPADREAAGRETYN